MGSAPAARGTVPSDARYRAWIPNAVIDTGLLAALPNDSRLFAYYLMRAHDDELWWASGMRPPRPPKLSSKQIVPLLQRRLDVSGRTVRRLLESMAESGWIDRSGQWVHLEPILGELCLDEIGSAEVEKLKFERAKLQPSESSQSRPPP